MLINAVLEKHENMERDAEIKRLSIKVNQISRDIRMGFIQKREGSNSTNPMFINFGFLESTNESKMSLINIGTPLFVIIKIIFLVCNFNFFLKI